MSRVLSIAWALLALAVSGPADGLRVEARAAWNGVARPGLWTELVVRVVSATGGEICIETGGGDPAVSWSGRVEAGVPALARIPARAGSSGPLAVRVRGPAGRWRRLAVPLERPPPGRSVVARVEAAPGRDAGGERLLVDVDPLLVPVAPRAFEAVDLLVLDGASLARLEARQIRAIQAHVRACGRVLLAGLPGPVARSWAALSACPGSLRIESSGGEPREALLQSLLEQRPPGLPGARGLAALLPGGVRRAAAAPLAGFFACYTLVLVLGSLLARRPWLPAVVPVLAGLLLPVALGASRPQLSRVLWIESVSGAGGARVAALERVEGMARRSLRLGLAPGLGPPDTGGTRRGIRLLGRLESPGALEVEIPTALLSEHRLYRRGVLDWRAPLRLAVAGAVPRVRNPGRAATPGGYLLWHQAVFAIPPLAGGVSWTPAGGDPLGPADLPAWVAARSRRERGAVVLIPVVPGAVLPGADPDRTVAWSLIRAGGEG